MQVLRTCRFCSLVMASCTNRVRTPARTSSRIVGSQINHRKAMVTFVGPQSGPVGMATTNSCAPAPPFIVMFPIALRVFWLPTLNGMSMDAPGPRHLRRTGADGTCLTGLKFSASYLMTRFSMGAIIDRNVACAPQLRRTRCVSPFLIAIGEALGGWNGSLRAGGGTFTMMHPDKASAARPNVAVRLAFETMV